MIDFDAIAEQHQTMDGKPLIDYFPVGLPIYLLQLDSLVAERRSLMPVEEFVLRAIHVGAKSPSDALGLLGIGERYGARLIEALTADEYIASTPDLALRPKGMLVLVEAGERRIYEKVLSLAWDPLAQRMVKSRLTLMKGQQLRLQRLVRLAPISTRLPPLIEFPLEHLPGNQLLDKEQVIRYLSVHRRTLMYAPAVLLLYGRGRNSEPLARVAVDGVVDSASSDAVARNELLLRLGVDGLFTRRLGATAVDQRVKPLGLLPGSESLSDLLTLKSTLQLGIAALERRSTDDAAARLESKKAELQAVQAKLAEIPVRSMLPFEMPRLVETALQNARHEVLITTTIPIDSRLTPVRLLLLDQALKRNVKVRILISDRPTEDEFARQEGSVQLLRRLNEMMVTYPHLEVSFLKDTDRVVFEVRSDDVMVGVANEPPLGMRHREPLARVFSGYQLSGAKSVQTYAANHLSAQALGVVGRIRMPHPSQKGKNAERR